MTATCGSFADVTAQGIEEVRLTAFKSFRDQVFRLAPLTVLIGRNSSGKSNALDGLEVLSRLARGEDISEALESRRGPEGPVRGGLVGCVPHGSDRFSLGCSVRTERGPIHLDVTVQMEPEVRIIEERLSGPTAEGHQYVLKSGQDSVWCAETMISTLEGVFHLDPVPHLMRQYVPLRDSHLRRTGENLSAAVGNIQRRNNAAGNVTASRLEGFGWGVRPHRSRRTATRLCGGR